MKKITLSEWKIEDYLKTPEERAAYIEAAAEEGTPDAIPDAFGDVFRAMGKPAEAAVCEGLAAYLRTVGASAKSGRAGRQPQRKARTREMATA